MATAAAASSLTVVAAASAAFPGRDGVIAFSCLTCGSEVVIAVVRPDGTNLHAVRPDDGRRSEETSAAWSPDGTRLAYERDGEVWTIDADGRNEQRLTLNIQVGTGQDSDPTWSPDASKIAFVRYGVQPPAVVPESAIFVMRNDGLRQTRLTRLQRSGSNPAWSPNGSKIAFSGTTAIGVAIFVVNVDGSGLKRLTSRTGEAYHPSWSPDGRRIAFVGRSTIRVMNADGTNERVLTRIGHDRADGLSWSPNGRKIAFSAQYRFSATESSRGIFVMNSDGTNRRMVAPHGYEPDWQPLCTHTGTSGRDLLGGTSKRDVMCGLGGNDVLVGFGGNDVLIGGGDDDVVSGRAGRDTLFGSGGADRLYARDGRRDIVDGGRGSDGARVDGSLDARRGIERGL